LADVAGADYTRLFNAWVEAESHTPRRGLLIQGEFGCGKTLAARSLYPRARIVNCAVGKEVEGLRDGDSHWSEMYDLYEEGLKPFAVTVLDDMGADAPTNDYGETIDAVGEFIIRAHKDAGREMRDSYRSVNIACNRLVITTNLPLDEKSAGGRDVETIDSRYGGRVASRLKELCVFVEMKGGDKRR
jgi:hypothetical protein